jgi:hypothetical protein
MVDSIHPLACRPSHEKWPYEMVPWIPEWDHFDTDHSSREIGSVLKGLAKWEIRAILNTIISQERAV